MLGVQCEYYDRTLTPIGHSATDFALQTLQKNHQRMSAPGHLVHGIPGDSLPQWRWGWDVELPLWDFFGLHDAQTGKRHPLKRGVSHTNMIQEWTVFSLASCDLGHCGDCTFVPSDCVYKASLLDSSIVNFIVKRK